MSNSRKFSTQADVDRLRPIRDKQIDYRDTQELGLGLRVSYGGRKTYYASYRFAGKQVRSKLGTHPYLSLKDARKAARAILTEVDRGKNPAAEKLKRNRMVENNIFGDVVDDYIQKHARPKTKRWKETKSTLDRHFVQKWRSLSISEIDKNMVRETLDALIEEGKKSTANQAFATLRAFFSWAVEQDRCLSSPCSRLKKPVNLQSRDRVLNDKEIVSILEATDGIGGPYAAIVGLLFYTGQRKSEVAGARFSEFDLDNRVWEIPAKRTKASRRNKVALVPSAVRLLPSLPDEKTVLVFPARGRPDKPVSGFSKWKRILDQKSGVSGWRIHDIRRTVATKLAAMGTPPQVIGKVLNHSDAVAGVAKVYNRHDYFEEASQALHKWEERLLDLRQTAKSNAIKLEEGPRSKPLAQQHSSRSNGGVLPRISRRMRGLLASAKR